MKFESELTKAPTRQAAGEEVDRTFDGFDRAQGIDHALACGELGLFDGAARGDLAGSEEFAVFHGQLAGDVEEVAEAFDGDVGAEGAGDGWQFNSQIF